MKFGIRMGCLAAPIKEQVKEQGLLISDKKAEEFQLYVESINILYMNNILNETEKDSAQKKLFTQIKKAVRLPKGEKL